MQSLNKHWHHSWHWGCDGGARQSPHYWNVLSSGGDGLEAITWVIIWLQIWWMLQLGSSRHYAWVPVTGDLTEAERLGEGSILGDAWWTTVCPPLKGSLRSLLWDSETRHGWQQSQAQKLELPMFQFFCSNPLSLSSRFNWISSSED